MSEIGVFTTIKLRPLFVKHHWQKKVKCWNLPYQSRGVALMDVVHHHSLDLLVRPLSLLICPLPYETYSLSSSSSSSFLKKISIKREREKERKWFPYYVIFSFLNTVHAVYIYKILFETSVVGFIHFSKSQFVDESNKNFISNSMRHKKMDYNVVWVTHTHRLCHYWN